MMRRLRRTGKAHNCNQGRVLLIAPAGRDHALLARELEISRWSVEHCVTASEGLASARQNWPDAFLVEQSLLDLHWAELIIQLRLERPELLALILLLQFGVPRAKQLHNKRYRAPEEFDFLLNSLKLFVVSTRAELWGLLQLLKQFAPHSSTPFHVQVRELDDWTEQLLEVRKRLSHELDR